MTVLFPNNQVRIERLCPRWPRRCAAYSRTAPHSDVDCRIQNREPLRASRESETTGNSSLHQRRRRRGSRTCWLCSGHLTVWRIARTDHIRLPKLPKGRVAHAAGPSAAILQLWSPPYGRRTCCNLYRSPICGFDANFRRRKLRCGLRKVLDLLGIPPSEKVGSWF
jgi:hypothetical protein